MSIIYKPTEPLEVGIGESMPAEFIKETERSRARIISLTDEIKRLQADNAKLRELVAETLIAAHEYAKKAQSENAKLRELARDIHALATDNGVYVRYPYCDAWDEKLAVVEKQMRELGIEAG